MPFVHLPPQHRKSYVLSRPQATHWRPASCDDVGCERLSWGFIVRADERTELGQRQAHYIRREAGRRFAETREPSGLTAFHFPPGEQCFDQHQAPVQREPLYLIRDGDKRGNPRGTPTKQLREEQWVDDFATHQDNLADRMRQG